MTSRTIPALLLATLAVAPSQATQLVPTRLILVKNPVAGPAARLVVWKAREKPSGDTIIGDPTVGGAKLRIRLRPGGDQCVTLPRTGWTRIGTGYRYKDAALANGPVRTASIKKKLSGTFQIQAILVGSGVTVVPGNPTVDYATNLSLVGGDDYRSGWGGAFPHPNDAFTFKVKNDGAAGVQVDPCSPGGAFLDPS
jgi:hypothetical protein